MLEIRKISEKDLPEVEEMYTASVRDNPRGFIQQLHLFPNIRDFIRRTETEGGRSSAFFKTAVSLAWAAWLIRAAGWRKSANFTLKKNTKAKNMAKNSLVPLKKQPAALILKNSPSM